MSSNIPTNRHILILYWSWTDVLLPEQDIITHLDTPNLVPRGYYLLRRRKWPWPQLVTWHPEFWGVYYDNLCWGNKFTNSYAVWRFCWSLDWYTKNSLSKELTAKMEILNRIHIASHKPKQIQCFEYNIIR